jgi:hypothetical protein
MLPRKIAAGMRILRGPVPITGCLTATLGLLVIGYPLPPSAVGSLLGCGRVRDPAVAFRASPPSLGINRGDS